MSSDVGHGINWLLSECGFLTQILAQLSKLNQHIELLLDVWWVALKASDELLIAKVVCLNGRCLTDYLQSNIGFLLLGAVILCLCFFLVGLLELYKIHELAFIEVPHSMVIRVIESRKVKSFLDLMDIQVKWAIMKIHILTNAKEAFKFLLSRNVINALTDSFSDKWNRKADGTAVQYLLGYLQAHINWRTVLRPQDLEDEVGKLLRFDKVLE